MELPVVATVEIQGERVQVRAASVALALKLAKVRNTGGSVPFETAVEVISKCCTRAEDGKPLDLDALSLESATRLVRIAVGDEKEGGKAPDFS